MRDRTRKRSTALGLVGLLSVGCAAMSRPDAGSAGPSATVPPDLAPRTVTHSPVMRSPRPIDASLPAGPAFIPGPNDLLRDLAVWDRATSAERLARAQALLPLVPGFTLRGLSTFECGTQRHEVAVFVHARTQMEFVLVPCGTLIRASPEGPRTVTIASPFLIARTEVTRAVWTRQMEEGVELSGAPDVAVGDVTWEASLQFVRSAGCDLPSADQWVFACQAGATTVFGYGDDERRFGDFAWFAGNSSGRELHAVGLKAPNAFGLYDMHGNAREWCAGTTGSNGYRAALGECAGAGWSSNCWLRPEGSSHWCTGLRPVRTIARPAADPVADDEVLRVTAVGFQVYRCDDRPDGMRVWTLKGPIADLFDADGRKIGTHRRGASGPEWVIGPDTVVGEKVSERPSETENSIPQLELRARSSTGGGPLTDVHWIERTQTVGGVAPGVAGDRPGTEVRVPYTAVYVFHRSAAPGARRDGTGPALIVPRD